MCVVLFVVDAAPLSKALLNTHQTTHYHQPKNKTKLAYNENIGAMQMTRVGSRRVIQVAAVIIIVFSVIGKFGGLFASIPKPMVSGLFCVLFGIIAAVGLAQMSHTKQHAPRNVFILGFSLYMGLSVAYYFTTTPKAIQSGNATVDQVRFFVLWLLVVCSCFFCVCFDVGADECSPSITRSHTHNTQHTPPK